MTWPVMVSNWLLMPSFCLFSSVAIELKRLPRVWAMVKTNWRAELSLGLAEDVCNAAKKLFKAAPTPVDLSDSSLSTEPIWSR